jgi:hypothetical protein
MVGLGYALLESLREKDMALSVVLASALLGCSVTVCVIVGGLMKGERFRNVWIKF